MIKRFFEKDSVLKIVSVFVALLVWLYVIYIEDPEIETTIDDVKITYKTSELEDDLCLVDYEIKYVDVKVSGNRSDVIGFDNSDLSAVLDLSSINEAGEYNDVKIAVTSHNKKVEIVESSEKNSTVKIDNVISKKFDIKTEYEGEMPDGYIVTGEKYLDNTSVFVKGAKTYVDNIKGAFVKINRSELSENRTLSCGIYLRDKDGNVIDENHKVFKYVEIGEDEVPIYITVGKTKTVPIKSRDTDEFEVVSISPDEVEIHTENSSVNEIYTESLKNKEPDEKGYISVKLDIPGNVDVIGDEQIIKVKVKRK